MTVLYVCYMCKCQRARELCNVLLQFVVVVVVMCATKNNKKKRSANVQNVNVNTGLLISWCLEVRARNTFSVSRLSVFFGVLVFFCLVSFSSSVHNYLDNDNLKLALKDTKGFDKWTTLFVLILIKIRYFAINWNSVSLLFFFGF